MDKGPRTTQLIVNEEDAKKLLGCPKRAEKHTRWELQLTRGRRRIYSWKHAPIRTRRVGGLYQRLTAETAKQRTTRSGVSSEADAILVTPEALMSGGCIRVQAALARPPTDRPSSGVIEGLPLFFNVFDQLLVLQGRHWSGRGPRQAPRLRH